MTPTRHSMLRNALEQFIANSQETDDLSPDTLAEVAEAEAMLDELCAEIAACDHFNAPVLRWAGVPEQRIHEILG